MITGGTIKRLVADEFGITIPEMDGNCRSQRLAQPRRVAMWIIRFALGSSYSQIGRLFRRDPTTIHHAMAVIEDRRARDPDLAARMDRLLAACRPEAIDIPSEQIPDAAARMVDALVDEFRAVARRAALRDPQAFVARAMAMLAEGDAACAP
ncbi:hypothetical protein H261_11949 [Paramagnetospirillum caucaseum]|uniref:Chromosomal replication initiator DnaA C-terminal domain-containing protein n=1 Tax=Paramagnetospirillum caucaseum TaxID=1244869 RepID=M2Y9P5_9PROT|nr:helix-turn-helix domain-containing protein [Paramagnetospirillum caucaseum]EME69746.1 hypothetical protein H261_11949 [Paramagnetospirillum caucaseum]